MIGRGDNWIVIPHWDSDADHEGFQHYSNRDPIWIKDYRSQLNNDDYLSLSFHLRGVLHDLRLAYAASHRQLRDNTSTLNRQLGGRVTTPDLKRLNEAGFIEFSASKPLAPCYPREEKEKEKKPLSEARTSTPTIAAPTGTKPAATDGHLFALRTLIANGVIRDLVDLEAELRSGDHPNITQEQRDQLAATLPEAA
jgi:hypothetical protein